MGLVYVTNQMRHRFRPIYYSICSILQLIFLSFVEAPQYKKIFFIPETLSELRRLNGSEIFTSLPIHSNLSKFVKFSIHNIGSL